MWRSVWAMRRAAAPRRRSRRNRSARSWHWPARIRRNSTSRSASGRRANWPDRRSAGASSAASRTARSGAFLKSTDLKPHRSRYWLTPKPDPDFEAKCADICALYQAAPTAAEHGVQTISIDEMTGIQALERAAPGLPMKPGHVERREFEYIRHGTQALIAAFDVATGRVIGTVGDSRTEADDVGFLERLFTTTAASTAWHVICDNLNPHVSEG